MPFAATDTPAPAMDILLAFSISQWFFDAWGELVRYFNHMNTWQWGIVSASAVIFGFLCLKGHAFER